MHKIANRNILILILLICISLLFAYLNRNCVNQQGALIYHINLMNFYKGDIKSFYSLYPLWGYPLVLIFFKNYSNIIYFQSLLGGVLLYLYYIYLSKFENIKCKSFFVILLAIAFPVHAVISTIWPASFQLIFICLSILFLLIAKIKDNRMIASFAGILMGLAANFRSEYIYFSFFLLFFLVLLHLVRLYKLNLNTVKLLAVYLLFTWIAMLPLGLERLYRTGNFNLKVGNGDWVNIFFSIGQLPGNSLSIKFDDIFVEEYLKQNVKEKYNTNQPLHMQKAANDFCKRQFLSYLKHNKMEFAAKLFHNTKSVITGGFYIGQIEQSFSKKTYLKLILFKEFYKKESGTNNSLSNLELLFDNGLIKNINQIQKSDISLIDILSVMPLIILNLFFLIVFIGTIIVVFLRIYIAYRYKMLLTFSESLILTPIIYGSILMIIGLYENRFSSMFYLFVIISLIIQLNQLKILKSLTMKNKQID